MRWSTVLFGMLWRGELAADLEHDLLGPVMLVHARGAGVAGSRGSDHRDLPRCRPPHRAAPRPAPPAPVLAGNDPSPMTF
jgi:hypothetical protein